MPCVLSLGRDLCWRSVLQRFRSVSGFFYYYYYLLHSSRDGKQKAPCCYSNHLLCGSVEHGASNLRRVPVCAGGAFMKHTSVVVLHCVHSWPWERRRFRKGARLNTYPWLFSADLGRRALRKQWGESGLCGVLRVSWPEDRASWLQRVRFSLRQDSPVSVFLPNCILILVLWYVFFISWLIFPVKKFTRS